MLNQPLGSLKNKKYILITGCSSGIGEYLAYALNQMQAYHVLATARNEEDLQTLKENDIDCHFLELNDSQSIAVCVKWALSKSNDKIYGLINNAAYGQPGAVEDLSREVLRQQFETNVFGTHELTCLILKNMRSNNEGKIIQISSILGLCCLPYRGAYNASKYALEALTDTMRLECMDSNIKFSLINPGPIRSHFRKNAIQYFRQNIDIKNSYHNNLYDEVDKRLDSQQDAKFTLSADAILPVVLQSLESKSPSVRKTITLPAKVLWILKRFLPHKWLDYLIFHKFNN